MLKQIKKITKTTITLLLLYHTPGKTTEIELPELGDSAYSVLKPHKEKKLGETFYRTLQKHLKFIEDPIIYNYYQKLTQQLTQAAQTEKTFNFFIVNNTEINAFAGPNGHIGIHTGLWTTSQTESELAGVLAHEIAHVTQHHIARRYQKQMQMAIPNLAALLAAIVVAGHNSQAGNAALTTLAAGSTQLYLNHSRQAEQEADRIGIDILKRTEIDPYGMPAFFNRLQQAYRYYPKPPKFLLTHPITEDRIAEATQRLQNLPTNTLKLNDELEYKLTKARLKFLLEDSPYTILTNLKNKTPNLPITSTTLPKHYTYILALIKNKNYQQALNHITKIQKRYPHMLLFDIAKAESYSKQNKHNKAITTIKNHHLFAPTDHGLTMAYTAILNNAKQHRQAITLLKKEKQRYPYNTNILKKIYLYEGKAGNMINALITHAEYETLMGNYDNGIKLLEQAKRLSKDKQYYQLKITAHIDHIKELKQNN